MIAGGIVAAFLGVKAEGQSLESIAKPLTAEDAETAAARARQQAGGAVEPRYDERDSGSRIERAGRVGSASASSSIRAASAPTSWCGTRRVVSGGRSLSR